MTNANADLPTRQGPLTDMRVLELAHIMAGPVCGLMLADLGADVIKVEKPAGDDTRRMVPPKIGDESAAFMMMNRNKRGIALDLKSDDARNIILSLIENTDVLIENYSAGTMDRLGIGYETLKEINPALVYCEISGYGRTGPYATRPGFDLVAQGMSGLMSVTGEGADRPPTKVGPPVTDITAGILAALGCVSAFHRAKETGEGQRVDTSLFEAGITQTYWQSAIALATGTSPGALGSAHPLNAPYQAFETADGWINIGAANQRSYERMLDAINLPDLKDDPRFATNADRMANLTDLVSALAPTFKSRTTDEWLATLQEANVPAGPVLSITDMHAHPQTIARNMVPTVTHTTLGDVQTLGLPIKLSDTPGGVVRAAPLLGEHSREILTELGYEPNDIDRFITTGAVFTPD